MSLSTTQQGSISSLCQPGHARREAGSSPRLGPFDERPKMDDAFTLRTTGRHQQVPMKLSLSKVIDRPPAVVWQFFAVDHLRNHPRWDPMMELRQLTEGPIAVGTRIERRHTRLGVPIEGTMEVVEFEPKRAMSVVIHDSTPTGELEVHSRMTAEPVGEGRTIVTIHLDIPSMAASMDPSMIEGSLKKMKELIEAET